MLSSAFLRFLLLETSVSGSTSSSANDNVDKTSASRSLDGREVLCFAKDELRNSDTAGLVHGLTEQREATSPPFLAVR